MKKKNLQSRDGYDLMAADYHEQHDHLDSFDWAVAKKMISELCPPEARVLDAGCGDGRVFRRINPNLKDLIGMDVSAKMLERLVQKNPDARVVQGDILSPPFRPASFHAILAFFLLVHLPELGVFFSAVSSLLKRDGVVLCNTIPQRSSPVFGSGTGKYIIRSYDHSFREISAEAGKAGFILLRNEPVTQKIGLISTVCAFQWPY